MYHCSILKGRRLMELFPYKSANNFSYNINAFCYFGKKWPLDSDNALYHHCSWYEEKSWYQQPWYWLLSPECAAQKQLKSRSLHRLGHQLVWWRHQLETFSALLALCARIHRWLPPHKGQWRGALMFSLIWTNGWVNNREAGDLRRHRTHYDVIVMHIDTT